MDIEDLAAVFLTTIYKYTFVRKLLDNIKPLTLTSILNAFVRIGELFRDGRPSDKN